MSVIALAGRAGGDKTRANEAGASAKAAGAAGRGPRRLHFRDDGAVYTP